MVTSETGSSNWIRAAAAASRKASAPAAWKAASEESTLCALPPSSVTRMSTTGNPADDTLLHLGPHPFFHRGDEGPRNHPAHGLVNKFEAGATFQRLDVDVADGVLAVASGLLDVPAVARRPAPRTFPAAVSPPPPSAA